MSNLEKKREIVNEIKEKVSRARSIVIVDARGLTVAQDTDLRKKLREAGVDYKVYKNTLINLAIQDTEFSGLSEFLKEPTTMAISYDEPTTAAKIINKELKALPKLEFKAGIVEGVVYDGKGIQKIADIPSKEELLSRLLGSFKSPMASFARVVKAIADKSDEGAAS